MPDSLGERERNKERSLSANCINFFPSFAIPGDILTGGQCDPPSSSTVVWEPADSAQECGDESEYELFCHVGSSSDLSSVSNLSSLSRDELFFLRLFETKCSRGFTFRAFREKLCLHLLKTFSHSRRYSALFFFVVAQRRAEGVATFDGYSLSSGFRNIICLLVGGQPCKSASQG